MHLALKKFIVPMAHAAAALVYAGRSKQKRRVLSRKVEPSGERHEAVGDQAASALRCGVGNEVLALGRHAKGGGI